MRLRISFALAAAVAAIAALTIGVGSAAAGGEQSNGPPDPQTTNIPYVAWAGETVKVVKCLGFGPGQTEASVEGHGFPFNATASIEDWSGVDETHSGPVIISPPNAWFTTSGLCFSFEVTSQKPGLAVYKLSINNAFIPVLLSADSLDQHQFLVIWLQDQAPVINEQAGANLGDPTGNGIFNPIPGAGGKDQNGNALNSFENGWIHILVKGTFPFGNDFASYGRPTVTLPDDWAWLASHLAVDDSLTGSNRPGAAANRWDIHDDDATTEGHVSSSFCADKLTATTVDAVDNCLGAPDVLYVDPDLGPFSNIYGGTDAYAFGPFDPVRPFDTLLSDGKLDAGDAPMPALRVDVNLSADSTVGTLVKADKTDIYNRNDATDPTGANPHDLYAPFYKALIPATLPGEGSIFSWAPLTSGVAGHASNNFTSFLGFTDPSDVYTTEEDAGIYDYWDTFTTSYSHGYNSCYDASGNAIPLPHGATGVAVYTDEHGEAYVQYDPYPGIVLTPDSNGRCDIYGPTPPVGHSTITATSVYPDQPVLWDGGNKTSNPLTKTVNYASSKVLNCIPKGTNEAFCVETILDPQGNPVVGAPVEFSAQAFQGSQPVIGRDAAKVGSYDTRDPQKNVVTPLPPMGRDTSEDRNFVDITTNGLGQASIDVVSTTGSCIDVLAENTGTRNGGKGILRSTDFNPTSGAKCGTTSGGSSGGSGGSSGGTGGSGGSTGGTTTAPVVTAAPVAVSTPVPTAKTAPAAAAASMTLATAQVVKIGQGRYLIVRVNGPAKTAKLKITLISKTHGKVSSRVITRYVVTNKQVRVGSLKLAPSIRSVRVALG
jgi:hypothetical protein